MSSKRKPPAARELLFGDLWEFDPSPETAPPHLDARYGLFLNGKFAAPKTRKHFDTLSPRNGEKLSELALAGKADVDAAYRAAAAAFPAWSACPGAERAKYLFRIARLLQDRAREFAVAETLDSGIPIKQARDFDLPLAAAQFFYHAGWADKLAYVTPGRTLAPLGVIGQILAWNSPLRTLAGTLAPALATGNTVVVKPAETTSLTALKFASLLLDAGLPAGVVNIVTGAAETGDAVVRHPLAAKISFTGSAAVGQTVQRALAGSSRRLSLALGGKAVHILLEDAPLDQAVEGVMKSFAFHHSQVYSAGSLLLVQESIAETILTKLKHRLQTFRSGDPLDKNTDLGAVHSADRLARIREFIQSGVDQGAGLYQPSCRLPATGYYVPPTLFSGVSGSQRIAGGEGCGPVLSLLTFRTAGEAVEKANNSAYGLSAGVWSDKGARILQLARELKAGVVWANGDHQFDPASPFGGYKESGFGRDGGKQGLLESAQLV